MRMGPPQTFSHVSQSGPSGLKCADIQRAGRDARRHLQHMGVDEGGGNVWGIIQ